MEKFIHIGMRKCASTTMQFVLQDHEDIYFLGKIKNDGSYITEELGILIENSIIRESEITYNEALAKSIIQRHFDLALEKDAKAFGFSDEGICGPDPTRVNHARSFERISNIMGENTKIILLLRNQWKFLLSQYKQFIKHGLTCPYVDYIQYLVINKDAGVLPFLHYDKLLKLLKKYFKEILILPFECFVKETHALEDLFQFIGVKTKTYKLPQHNRAPDDKLINAMLYINGKFPYIYGNAELNALGEAGGWAYLSRNLKSAPITDNFAQKFDKIYNDDRSLSQYLAHALSQKIDPCKYDLPPKLENWLNDIFKSANCNLQKHVNYDLSQLGYPM